MKKILNLFLILVLVLSSVLSFTGCSGKMVYELNEDSTGYIAKVSGKVSGDVVIPNYYEGKPVVKISEGCFNGCKGMKSITIPDTVKSISADAFVDCKSLQKVYYEGIISQWAIIEFENVSANPLWTSSSEDHHVELYVKNEMVTETKIATQYISDYAFAGYRHLRKIDIELAEEIGVQAFSNCTGLLEVTFDNSLKLIKEHAFRLCGNIKDITITKNVYKIEPFAFTFCDALENAIFVDNKGWAQEGYEIYSSTLSDTGTAAEILKEGKILINGD